MQVVARASSFIIAIGTQLVMGFLLAGNGVHFGPGQVAPLNGVFYGSFVWASFVATSLSVNYSSQRSRSSLTFVDGGHWVGALLVQGFMIGPMDI